MITLNQKATNARNGVHTTEYTHSHVSYLSTLHLPREVLNFKLQLRLLVFKLFPPSRKRNNTEKREKTQYAHPPTKCYSSSSSNSASLLVQQTHQIFSPVLHVIS